jgi:hypothetical protein
MHTSAAIIVIILCVVIGSFIPLLWGHQGGRDFRQEAAASAFLILFASAFFYGRLRWKLTNLLIALLIIEILTLFIIGDFSGYSGFEIFDSFNLDWLLYLNIFIGLPWLLGLLPGIILRKGKNIKKN